MIGWQQQCFEPRKEETFLEEFQPSSTAQRVAMKRAAHQLVDDPRIFDDPLALHIIGKEHASALQADPRQFDATPLSPYLRAFVAARSRLRLHAFSIAIEPGATVAFRCSCAAGSFGRGAVASILRPRIADKRLGSDGLFICRGQWA